jgi:16S rRNA C1402 N4-methylase RsmH
MKRLPVYADVTQVEHCAPMVQAVVQAVVGGRRWEDMRAMSDFITEKGLEDGTLTSSTKVRRAFSLPPVKQRKRKLRRTPERRTPLGVFQSKRVVTYDVLDCTFGGGMHSAAILEAASPYARVVGMDCDFAAGAMAKKFAAHYGSSNFRFFGNKMSESLSMFGENTFDAVLIDPGPTDSQLQDPRRGFLLSSEHNHPMDMRYGPQMRLSALSYLNSCSQSELKESLAKYGLLSQEQCFLMARNICSRRPFIGSHHVVGAVSSPGEEWDDSYWKYQSSLRKLSLPAKFFFSLRGVVNNEWYELKAATENGILMLRDGGRLVMVAAHEWERQLVRDIVKAHPSALLLYEEDILPDEVMEDGHSRHTRVVVVGKTIRSSFPIKNINISEEEVRQSATEWVAGAVGGQSFGFPANNFSFSDLDRKEKKTLSQNRNGPAFDRDDTHWDNPRKPIG